MPTTAEQVLVTAGALHSITVALEVLAAALPRWEVPCSRVDWCGLSVPVSHALVDAASRLIV